MATNWCYEDYYNIELHDESTEWDPEEHEYGTLGSYSVVYQGESYDCREITKTSFGSWNDQRCIFTLSFADQVPAGYDGVVHGLLSAGLEWEDGQHIYDVADTHTVFFRMK